MVCPLKYSSQSNVDFKLVPLECCVGLSLSPKKEWVDEILNKAILVKFMLDISVGGLIRFTHNNDTDYCFQKIF